LIKFELVAKPLLLQLQFCAGNLCITDLILRRVAKSFTGFAYNSVVLSDILSNLILDVQN